MATWLEYIQVLEEALFNVAILVSPRAYVAPSAQLMKGTIVEPMAVVNANAVVAGTLMKMKNMLGCNEVYGDVESGKQE